MPLKLRKARKSNHKKKSWKHIDLAEIDQYLDDKELDERTGRTGEKIYFINKEGDDENIKKDRLDDNLIDEEEKTIINNTKPTTKGIIDQLKCFRHLDSTSAVSAFKSNKPNNQKQTPLESARQNKRLEKVAKSLEKPKKKICKEDKNSKYDLWEVKEKTPIGDVYVDYAEDFEKVRLSRIFKCPSKVNPNVSKNKTPTLLPAVEEPHPGLSYNPNVEDHTELLISIGEKKKKEIKKKRKLNKIIKKSFDPTINVELENRKEMASGLFSEDEEVIKSEDEVNNQSVEKSIIISDLKRRKTNKAKRDKIKMRIDMMNAKKRKEKKIFDAQFFKIKQYIKEAEIAEQKSNERKKIKEQRKIQKLYKPANLGKEKYKDPDPEFCLKEELNGSLRKINTDGNLLMDRFKSLQRRNLIEHRRVLLKKRSKPLRKNVIRNSIFNKDLFEKDNDERI